MLDFVKKNPDLRNVVKSISQNTGDLLLVYLLGLAIFYFFGIVGYLYFPQDFINSNGIYSNTFYLAFVSVINFGFENGGGIGNELANIPFDNG